MALPRPFLSYGNFELAFTRLVRSGNKEYKQFYRYLFPSYNLALRENLTDLIEDIKRGSYKPDPVTIIFQPKKSGVLRPLTLLSLRDLIVYQALGNFLAEAFEETQDKFALKRSFGALFAGKSSLFFYRSWKTCYSAYNDAISAAYKGGNKYVADFDLVSFYELIDHQLLRSRLAKKVHSQEFLDLLFECLEGWTNNDSGSHIGHGVPQGPETSAFIAECFLFDFDRLLFGDTRYFRYVDDIKLMSKDEVLIRRALVRLDLASKRLGLVPQAQKIECRKVRSLKEVLKTIPSSLAQESAASVKKARSQKAMKEAFAKSLDRKGRQWVIEDMTKFKYSINRMKARRDVLRRIAPFLLRYPDLSWVLSNYLRKFPKDRTAADVLLQALRRDPTYDSAAANYIDAMDVCEPDTNHRAYRRVVQTANGRSEERSILLPIAVSAFRGKRGGATGAIRLIEKQPKPRVQGILVHRLFGDHPLAPFTSTQCRGLLQSFADSPDPDLARYSAAVLLGHWPWFTGSMWRPMKTANRSVALLIKGLGLRKRAPKRQGVLEMYFQEQYRIRIKISWRKALGRDLRSIEERCLRLQKLMIGDPSARIMCLDTFNESLIQAFSTRHPGLKAGFANCISKGKAVPDYGKWLWHKNLLRNPQPRSTAMMARSRRPRSVVTSGALSNVCACRAESQLPIRMPTDLALLTLAIPAASSGARIPLSAASAASLRIADMRMMIDDEPSLRSSNDTRHALTVALVKPGRGACLNHARNSSSAMLYTLFVIGEETLSSTICFNRSHSAGFSTTAKSFIFPPCCWALSVATSCGHYLGFRARIKRIHLSKLAKPKSPLASSHALRGGHRLDFRHPRTDASRGFGCLARFRSHHPRGRCWRARDNRATGRFGTRDSRPRKYRKGQLGLSPAVNRSRQGWFGSDSPSSRSNPHSAQILRGKTLAARRSARFPVLGLSHLDG